MTDVLIVASVRPQLGALAESVRKYHALGARVYLTGTFHFAAIAEELDAIGLDGMHQLPRNLSHRGQGVRRRAKEEPPGMRVWLQAATDPWLRQASRSADVLVALNPAAVYTVWRLAEHNRAAEAQFGLAPGLRALERVVARGGSAGRRGGLAALPAPSVVVRNVRRSASGLPTAVLRGATRRSMMRSRVGARLWRAAVAAPGVPAPVRAATSRQVAEGLSWAGRPGGAARALAAAADKVASPGLRADLLAEAVMQEIDKGIVPQDLDRAVDALLLRADALYAEGAHEEAAAALSRASVLQFHRVIHIDQLSSPLAKAPERYTDRFHSSTAVRAVAAERGRRVPAAPAPTDRPLRLLVTTSANDNFLKLILSHFKEHQDVEVRFLDLAARPNTKLLAWDAERMIADRLSGGGAYGEQLERIIRPQLDWADTVFLDWTVGPAVMLTTIDPGDTRIVVRLHSYEAFTRWPHLADFSRVDDLVFVADHVRDLTTALVPQLRGPQAPRTHVLDNAMDLSGFAREKAPEARFNLGLVGISQVAKDPLWALDVLELVRKQDQRYRLLLVGGDMQAKVSHATKTYLAEFNRRLEPLVESGAVLRLGPTDDVPAALTDIGTILSSSVREGCHVGLMEGAASSAVPVVRDWPFYAGRTHSARTLYPEGWVVGSPEEAARRILETTATEEAWHDAGKLASEHALAVWDWPVVSRHFEELLLPQAEA